MGEQVPESRPGRKQGESIASATRESKGTALILAAAALACFGLLAHYYWQSMGDDSFIYFRYAGNIAAGYGPVWNRGAPPVEGFSSPLWQAILAGAVRAGANALSFSRWAGWLLSVISIGMAFVLSRRLGASLTAASGVTLGLVLLRPIYTWSGSGLETPLQMVALASAAAALAGGRRWELSASGVLLALARPEGVFLATLFMFLAQVAGARRPRIVDWAIVLGTILTIIMARLAIFHVPFPNTYYAKVSGDRLGQIYLGLRYCIRFALWIAAFGVAAISVRGFQPRPWWAAGALVIAALGIVAGGGGDWMHDWRMLVPITPCAIALALFPPAGHRAVRFVFAASLLPLFIVPGRPDWLVRPGDFLSAVEGRQMPVTEREEGELIDASATLASNIRAMFPNPVLIAVNHAGALPYYLPEYPVLDMIGLSDTHIAREVTGGIHAKYDIPYVLGTRPGLVVLNSLVAPGTGGVWYHPGEWNGETLLTESPEFKSSFVPVPALTESYRWDSQQTKYLLVYARRELVR